MTGLRTRLGRTVVRAAVGAVGLVAATLLVAPAASATPDGDADAAITASWDAGGGPTGPLGIKDGGVYPAGAGFGQNFAGGKIFFTPETGAHAMVGAILDKYLSLGGPTDGDLGFPTIDEGDGRAPGSRNTTFSAADRPVIFWTPDTGARVVRGALNAAWDQLGGSAGVLGVPSEDEAYRGNQVSQAFTGGQLSWNRTTKTFTTTPPELAEQLTGLDVPGDVTSAIDAARRAAGGPLGPLGAPDGARYAIGADGAGQKFAGGKIFYSLKTGANVLTGQVLAKYESVGGPQGDLGFPTSDTEDGGLAPMSSIATFAAADQPAIFWTPDFGAVIVRGAMNAAWTKLGGATGQLGAPTADQTEDGDLTTQKFSGGAISWNQASGVFTTEPPGLASQLSGLQVPGRVVPQAPPATDAAGDSGSTWFHPTWWWLLGLVPVVVLVGVVTAAVLLNRRRQDRPDPLDGYDDSADYDHHLDEEHDFDSGSMWFGDYDDDDGAAGGRSGWAMPPGDETPDRSETVTSSPPSPDSFVADLGHDQDAIDTAPNHVVEHHDEHRDEHRDEQDDEHWDDDVPAAPGSEDDLEDEPPSGPPSGRHAAISLDEPEVVETSLRLANDGPFTAPDGYPIKADTKSGVYWLPGTGDYDHAEAEIWFASEEFALTNGFVRG